MCASTAMATDRFMDGGCTNAGTGTTSGCAATPGGAGAYNNLQTALNAAACGDLLDIKGAHSTHANCIGSGFDGRHGADKFEINSKNCTSGTKLIIQAHGWTDGANTQEQVFVESTTLSTWTHCTDCSGGSAQVQCRNVPAPCGDAWYFMPGAGQKAYVEFAQKPLGEPTFRVTNITDLDNSNADYSSKRCSDETWKACITDDDCIGSATCNDDVSPEIDSFTCNRFTGGCAEPNEYIVVRWGDTGSGMAPGEASNPKPHTTQNGTGEGFRVGLAGQQRDRKSVV